MGSNDNLLRWIKNMAIQGGTVSHYHILVIHNFFLLCRFSNMVCGFLFLLNNFPLQSLEYTDI